MTNDRKDQSTYDDIDCSMNVHNKLGNGFQEVIFQKCLAIELGRAKLDFAREVEQPFYYDGIPVGTRRADFELKN